MSKDTVIEYIEKSNFSKSAQWAGDFIEFSEDENVDDFLPEENNVAQYETIIEFDEDNETEPSSLMNDLESSLSEAVEYEEDMESSVDDFVEDDSEADDVAEEVSAGEAVRMLPGTSMSLADDEEDNKKDEEDDSPGSWKDDGDVRDFMRYVEEAYSNIPSHDGTTILGCERAINYLKDLDREVSKAISLDKNLVLDVSTLDSYRVNMMNDMMTLKNHIKKLQRKIREQYGKKASDGNSMKIAGSDLEFIKEATVARPQLVITPFERAISGMIVNAVVSSGKSFEDVYDVLKKKYAFTDREELAIIQLVSDMGYPIFKDRGTIGKESLDIDFLRNYFA